MAQEPRLGHMVAHDACSFPLPSLPTCLLPLQRGSNCKAGWGVPLAPNLLTCLALHSGMRELGGEEGLLEKGVAKGLESEEGGMQ